MAERPRVVVVAGPSGSGKSTYFPVAELGVAYFNVDDRCAELNGGSYQVVPSRVRQRAQKECEVFIERCTMEGSSFAVETTLRTDLAIRHEVLLFDSTAFDATPRLVAHYESGVAIMRRSPWPAWCLAALGQGQ